MMENNKENEEEEFRFPLLLKIFSKCSEFSEIDLEKQSPPPVARLRKLNSYLDQNANLDDFKMPVMKIQQPPSPSSPSVQQVAFLPCSCTKTRCLKMYCSCFHNARVCTDQCKCDECHNKEECREQRSTAVAHIRRKAHRNKKVPEEKLFETTEVWGCNCKKTRCKKRYCECFIRGKKCTVECNCDACDNGKDEDLIEEIRRLSEKPRHNKRVRTRAD